MVFFSQKSWWKYDIYWSLKSSCFDHFGNGKYGLFLIQKVDGKIIFTDYWKVLVLNFSVLGNTGFFWVTKLMEWWYLLVPEKFLFWTFRWWEIRPFCKPKSWWKDGIYLVFLSFPWYSRTWEIWFIVQWTLMCVRQWRQLSQAVIQYCANPISADKRVKEIQNGDHEIKTINFTDNTTVSLRDITWINRIQVILRLYENNKLVQR